MSTKYYNFHVFNNYTMPGVFTILLILKIIKTKISYYSHFKEDEIEAWRETHPSLWGGKFHWQKKDKIFFLTINYTFPLSKNIIYSIWNIL